MLKDYLDEAIKTGQVLEITNRKTQKVLTVIVERYDDKKIFFRYPNGSRRGSLFIENASEYKFHYPDKEKSFCNYLNDKPTIDRLCKYYLSCLKILKDKDNKDEADNKTINVKKEKIFQTIFDGLYKNKQNLLLDYFKGNNEVVNDSESNFNGIPILLEQSNRSQRKAIEESLKNNVSVIEGPPGTGKTTTILSIIANLICENKQVVVVSKNNSAVNNIIEEFEKTDYPEFYVRLGKKEIMDELKENASDKVRILENQLEKIDYNNLDLERLKKFKQRLDFLEKHLNYLMEIRSIINDLRNQQRFLKKRSDTYDFKDVLNESEKRGINKMNATPKNINRLIRLAHKKKYNFLTKLLLKYQYYLNEENLDSKALAMQSILQEIYLEKEIAKKESILLLADVDKKRKEINHLYKEYTNLCSKYFKYILKTTMTPNIPKNKDNLSENIIPKFMKIYPLVLTTADGFLFNFKKIINKVDKIDCVIIDEASQCDVLTGLPLLFLAKKIIVVGDSRQLSAITDGTVSMEIDEKYAYQNNDFLNTIKQVFNPPTTMLLEHYRCDYNIINFCNKYYYDNKLIIHTSNSYNSMGIINVNQYKGAEVINGSFGNKREIKTIIEQLNGNLENVFPITPFSAQATLLTNTFDEKNCGTIHRVQGRGADKVFFSTVLNDLGFCNKHLHGDRNLFKEELINVAVSRAKKEFILVTDRDYFFKNGKYAPDIKNLIDYIEVHGKKLEDKTVCIFDYLYKKVKFYNKASNCDNIYEKTLFDELKAITKEIGYLDCKAKIYLADLVQDKEFLRDNPDTLKYIKNGAHADFTLFDTRSGKPVLVIELDGKYHNDPKQIKRDKMKDEALKECNINVKRISSKDAIDREELKQIILDECLI